MLQYEHITKLKEEKQKVHGAVEGVSGQRMGLGGREVAGVGGREVAGVGRHQTGTSRGEGASPPGKRARVILIS